MRQVKLETGLRAGEAPALEWGDIDEKKRMLKINKNLVVWALLRQQPARSGCGSENHIQAAGPREIAHNRYIHFFEGDIDETLRQAVGA